ncbi:MAG: hypothetical protein K0S54_398 [Alphaproteobacteria bacterium]|jgi:hypothetical protein|nr:hypothetical protein [Alphaproteobacteria bacterium]
MPHCYEFAAPHGVFRIRSEVDIAAPLKLYVGRWPWREVVDAAAADVEILRQPEGGLLVRLCHEPELTLQVEYVMESASGALDMLIRLAMEQLGAFAMLHAGSALIDGRLVAFPGRSKAGKSTLALQLALRGHLLGGDDRMLVGPLGGGAAVDGVLLGLNARMRLPVDARAGGRFISYVEERRLEAPGLSPQLAFIAPRPQEMAPFGQRAALAALIVPVRGEEGGVALEPASFSDIMRLLLEEFYAPHWTAAELTQVARALAQAVPGFVLRFDDSAQAAAALERLARSGFRELVG